MVGNHNKIEIIQQLHVAGFVAIFIEANYLTGEGSNADFYRRICHVMLQHLAVYITLNLTMNLSTHEKQILAGPLVVGMLLGAFGAYAVFAFASELSLDGTDAPNRLRTDVEASVVFLTAVLGTVAVLGVLPIAVRRIRAKKGASDV